MSSGLPAKRISLTSGLVAMWWASPSSHFCWGFHVTRRNDHDSARRSYSRWCYGKAS